MKLDLCLSPCTKISSKWIKDLNARSETLKPLQKNTRKTLQDTCIVKDFLNMTSIAQEIRVSTDKWDCIKLKGFCSMQETIITVPR
jgi:hypothetical protein